MYTAALYGISPPIAVATYLAVSFTEPQLHFYDSFNDAIGASEYIPYSAER
jgi:hypothetical protein